MEYFTRRWYAWIIFFIVKIESKMYILEIHSCNFYKKQIFAILNVLLYLFYIKKIIIKIFTYLVTSRVILETVKNNFSGTLHALERALQMNINIFLEL